MRSSGAAGRVGSKEKEAAEASEEEDGFSSSPSSPELALAAAAAATVVFVDFKENNRRGASQEKGPNRLCAEVGEGGGKRKRGVEVFEREKKRLPPRRLEKELH